MLTLISNSLLCFNSLRELFIFFLRNESVEFRGHHPINSKGEGRACKISFPDDFNFINIPDELESSYFLTWWTFEHFWPSNPSQLTLQTDIRKTTCSSSKCPTLRSSPVTLINGPTCFLPYSSIYFLVVQQIKQYRKNVSCNTMHLANSNKELTIHCRAEGSCTQTREALFRVNYLI